MFRTSARSVNGLCFFALGSALTILGSPKQSDAQGWVKFADETAVRLIAEPKFGVTDTDEKQYAFGDFDQDGDTDLVVARKQEWTTTGRRPNVLFMNEGLRDGQALDGVLVDRTTEYASASLIAGSLGMKDETNDRDIAVVDVDGDGWLDFVTGTTLSGDQPKYISHPRVYINQGNDEDGNWLGFLFDDEDRIPTMPVEPRLCAVAPGDIDLDGDQDLYLVDYDSGPYSRPADLDDRLLINDGTGYFTDESTLRMTPAMLDSGFGTSASVGDMNGDGAPDVVKNEAGKTTIIYNNPNNIGYFNKSDSNLNLVSPYHVSLGDLNNDNKVDILSSNDGSDKYLLNMGNGPDGLADLTGFVYSFTGGETDDGFGSDNYAVDLNNDGWEDVIIADVDVDIPGCTRRAHIYRNLGNAPNVTMKEQAVGTNCGNSGSTTCKVAGITNAKLQGTHDVAVFDIDNDGWVDMVVGRCSSTEVYRNQPPIGLVFTYPLGLPAFVPPGEELTFQVEVTGFGIGLPAPGTGTMQMAINGGPFVETPITQIVDNLYEAKMPALDCLTKLAFYFTAQTTIGDSFSDPVEAPNSSYSAISALGEDITLRDEIEGDVSGWTVENDPSLTTGAWEQADPNQAFSTACDITSPEDDATNGEGIMAFVTENGEPGGSPNLADVDGGPTWLTSPAVDLAGSDATISYSQWFVSCLGTVDVMTVEVSNDGVNWVLVDTVADTEDEWQSGSFLVSDYVVPSETVQVRFSTVDAGTASITEAGIDNFEVRQLVCEAPPPPCEGDANGDGTVDPLDSGYVQARLGCSVGTGDPECDAADVNLDGEVDPLDVGYVLARLGDCP